VDIAGAVEGVNVELTMLSVVTVEVCTKVGLSVEATVNDDVSVDDSMEDVIMTVGLDTTCDVPMEVGLPSVVVVDAGGAGSEEGLDAVLSVTV